MRTLLVKLLLGSENLMQSDKLYKAKTTLGHLHTLKMFTLLFYIKENQTVSIIYIYISMTFIQQKCLLMMR